MSQLNGNNQAPTAPAVKLGGGNITFELDGEQFELKPTINAMKMLSMKYNGLQGVMDKIVQMDIMAIEDVLVFGLGPSYNTAKRRDALMTKVLGSGLTDDTGGFSLTCQKYVLSLMRGGKPLPTDDDAKSDEVPLEGNVKSSSLS